LLGGRAIRRSHQALSLIVTQGHKSALANKGIAAPATTSARAMLYLQNMPPSNKFQETQHCCIAALADFSEFGTE